MTADSTTGVEVLAEGLMFPEGPVYLPDGSILVVEIGRGTLTRVWGSGRTEVVADLGGGPNGAALGPDGAVYVTNNGGFLWAVGPDGKRRSNALAPPDYEGGRIERVELDTGKFDRIYTHVGGHQLRGPNDLVFDATGGFWFSDLGKQYPRSRDKSGVYYAHIDGSLIEEAVYDGLSFNGVGLSPGEDALYVADTFSGRLWSYAVASPGVLECAPHGKPEGRLIGTAQGGAALDSIAVTESGKICVGTLRDGGVTTFTPSGGQTFQPMSDPVVTNLCFGGEDRRTAYLTFSGAGQLVKMKWPEAGLPLNFANYDR